MLVWNFIIIYVEIQKYLWVQVSLDIMFAALVELEHVLEFTLTQINSTNIKKIILLKFFILIQRFLHSDLILPSQLARFLAFIFSKINITISI